MKKKFFMLMSFAWYANIGAMMAGECPTMSDTALLNCCRDGVQKDRKQLQEQKVTVPAISETTLQNEVQLQQREARLLHVEQLLQGLDLTKLCFIYSKIEELKKDMRKSKEIIVQGRERYLFDKYSDNELRHEEEYYRVWLEVIEQKMKNLFFLSCFLCFLTLEINQNEQSTIK